MIDDELEEVTTLIRNKYYESDSESNEWFLSQRSIFENEGTFSDDLISSILSFLESDTDLLNRANNLINRMDNNEQFLDTLFFGDQIINEEEDDIEIIEDPNDQDVEVDDAKYITYDEYCQRAKQSLQNFSKDYSVCFDITYLIFTYFSYNLDRMFNSYPAMKKEVLLNKLYLDPDSDLLTPLVLKATTKGSCVICMDDDVQLYSLSCGHECCLSCWKDCIDHNLKKKSLPISCFFEGCKKCLVPSMLDLFPPEVSTSFYSCLFNISLSLSKDYHLCINPKCGAVLTKNTISYCRTAKCKCGTSLCWTCGEHSHAPISCSNRDYWLDKADDQNLNSIWVIQNTKICPKCRTRIEKNKGCNHMTCSRCKHEFCWICGGDWSLHGTNYYNCTFYKSSESKDNNNNKPVDNVERLHHYFLRYKDQLQSQEIDKKNYDNNRQELQKYFLITNYFHSKEESEQQVDEILFTIRDVRNILIWSYPEAYQLDENSTELKLFENSLRNVETEMENLVYMVENVSRVSVDYYQKANQRLLKFAEIMLKQVEEKIF